MEVHTHVLWEAPADTKKVRLSMLPKVVELNNTMNEISSQVINILLLVMFLFIIHFFIILFYFVFTIIYVVRRSGSNMEAILYAGKMSDSNEERERERGAREKEEK